MKKIEKERLLAQKKKKLTEVFKMIVKQTKCLNCFGLMNVFFKRKTSNVPTTAMDEATIIQYDF